MIFKGHFQLKTFYDSLMCFIHQNILLRFALFTELKLIEGNENGNIFIPFTANQTANEN